jgi:hypothetical protein
MDSKGQDKEEQTESDESENMFALGCLCVKGYQGAPGFEADAQHVHAIQRQQRDQCLQSTIRHLLNILKVH